MLAPAWAQLELNRQNYPFFYFCTPALSILQFQQSPPNAPTAETFEWEYSLLFPVALDEMLPAPEMFPQRNYEIPDQQ